MRSTLAFGRHSGIVQLVVQERKSHDVISEELKSLYPNLRGLSSRRVRRYCKRHDIHATSRLTDSQLDTLVGNHNYCDGEMRQAMFYSKFIYCTACRLVQVRPLFVEW